MRERRLKRGGTRTSCRPRDEGRIRRGGMRRDESVCDQRAERDLIYGRIRTPSSRPPIVDLMGRECTCQISVDQPPTLSLHPKEQAGTSLFQAVSNGPGSLPGPCPVTFSSQFALLQPAKRSAHAPRRIISPCAHSHD